MEPRLTLNWQSIYLNFSNARIMVTHCLAFLGPFKRSENLSKKKKEEEFLRYCLVLRLGTLPQRLPEETAF